LALRVPGRERGRLPITPRSSSLMSADDNPYALIDA
jgi:hypothetical protein